MKTLDLDALEKLAKAATPGLWRFHTGRDYVYSERWRVCYFERDEREERAGEIPVCFDAEYIASISPDVCLALIERIRNLEKNIDEFDELLLLDRSLTWDKVYKIVRKSLDRCEEKDGGTSNPPEDSL